MKKLVLGGLVLAASVAFAPLAFADVAPVDPQVVAVKTQVACGTVNVTLTNNDVGAYGFEWHTVPWNGGDAGVKSGSITVAAGATVTQTIRLAEDSYDGKGAFTMGVVFGPNTFKQPFLDLGLVNTDCAPPAEPTTEPTVAPTTTPAPTTEPATPTSTVAPTSTTTATTPPLPTILPVPVPDPAAGFSQVGTVPAGSVDTGGGPA